MINKEDLKIGGEYLYGYDASLSLAIILDLDIKKERVFVEFQTVSGNTCRYARVEDFCFWARVELVGDKLSLGN